MASCQAAQVCERATWVRNMPATAALFAAIGIEYQRAGHASLRMACQGVLQAVQRRNIHVAIRVQEQQVLSLRQCGALIAGSGESAIIGISDDPQARIVGQLAQAVVGGGVVHHDDFERVALRLQELTHAFGQQGACVVVDGDDGDSWQGISDLGV